MSLSTLKTLERERAALAKRIAEERAKVAAKVGGDLMKSFGEDEAENLVAKLASAARCDGASATLAAVLDLLGENVNHELRNGTSASPSKSDLAP